jgi:hypothetical protein
MLGLRDVRAVLQQGRLVAQGGNQSAGDSKAMEAREVEEVCRTYEAQAREYFQAARSKVALGADIQALELLKKAGEHSLAALVAAQLASLDTSAIVVLRRDVSFEWSVVHRRLAENINTLEERVIVLEACAKCYM